MDAFYDDLAENSGMGGWFLILMNSNRQLAVNL